MGLLNVGRNFANKAYEYGLKKPFLWLSDSSLMNKGYSAYRANNRKIIDGIGIASIILKDGVGCYMYVNQSLHNDKIPEDKRKFVAALDLANGGLMILAQILMHVTISNKIVQTKMFNKMFGKNFDRNALKMVQSVLKNTEKYKDVPAHKVAESFNKMKNSVCDAFGSLTSLIAATTIGKRIIVPFIATPLAGKVETWMNKDKKEDVVSKDTANTYDTTKTVASTSVNSAKPSAQTVIVSNTAEKPENTNLLAAFKK